MKIFISWSGELSKDAAYVLRDWLPSVIQLLDTPWVSDVDIESGANWSNAIGEQLSTARFGIVCVTRENQAKPWLNFEAGAISRLVGGAVPLLIDFDSPADLLAGPMSQLQVRMTDETGITKLMHDINKQLDRPLDRAVLESALARGYPELQEKLDGLRRGRVFDLTKPERTLDDKVDEILTLVRDSRSTSPPPDYGYLNQSLQPLLSSWLHPSAKNGKEGSNVKRQVARLVLNDLNSGKIPDPDLMDFVFQQLGQEGRAVTRNKDGRARRSDAGDSERDARPLSDPGAHEDQGD